ncbi:MAG: iron-sulfur cluster assembly scaffold protein [Pelagibacteraceae bacterium]|tara:strand:+ start:812 stop:1204 length:393 start_codon:yes stop_codon:yes gene_type:complete
MIDTKIIKIASNTKNFGLRNVFTHRSSAKNSLCGDLIKIEVVAKNNKIKSMRYETESCILCEASANLLSRKINKFCLNEIKDLKKKIKTKTLDLPDKFKEFKVLLNKKNISRINCVILPLDALLKAFKIK